MQKENCSFLWFRWTHLPLLKTKKILRIFSSFESKTWRDMIFNNSFCMSWWVYLFRIVPSKWAIMLLSFVPSSIISCVKLSLFSFPCKAIPYLARYRKHLITSSKYFLSFSRTLTRLLLVISPTSLHFGITTWYEAALLWQCVCWCSSKHCGAFFHELTPLEVYSSSIFLSLSSIPFFLCVAQ